MSSLALSPQWLASQLPVISGTFYIAVSGGVDSMALLHLAARLRDQGGIRSVKAVHVHHGLQAVADEWAEQVAASCTELEVPLLLQRVTLKGSDNIEAQARAARYRVFERYLESGDVLLLAHHQRDQAETLLYRLCRGTGPRGLAAMPRQRPLGKGRLYRPLLDCPKEQLLDYAERHKLCWVEDPSNSDHRFDRNFLRGQILPALSERWPRAPEQIARAAAHCAEEQALLTEYARTELAALMLQPSGLLAGLVALDWQLLAEKTQAKQRLLLRTWLSEQGCELPQTRQLDRMLSDLLTPRADADPCFEQPGWSLRRYRGALYLLQRQAPAEPVEAIELDSGAVGLPGNGRLLIETRTTGARLALGERFALGYRSEEILSQRFALVGRCGRKSLKKWCQEAGIPPWLRDRIPLLFQGGQLAAIVGIGIVEGFAATEQQTGLACQWLPSWRAC